MAARNVDWLLYYDDTDHVMKRGEVASLSGVNWRGTLENIELGDGLRVFLTRADVSRPFTVEPSKEDPAQWLNGNIAVAGHVRIDMPDGLSATVDSDTTALFRGNRARYSTYRGQLLLTGYSVRHDRLQRTFGDDLPPLVAALLGRPDASPMVVTTATSPAIQRLAGGSCSSELTGALRSLYLEGAVAQMLALQAAGLADIRHKVPAAKREDVLAARLLLISDMRNPPTLGQLAARIGVNEKALNAGFRTEFGMTAFELLRNERLDHARLALLDGGLTIKEAATRVGYQHVGNFITAFSSRFGEPPGRYLAQRGQRAEADH